MWQTGSATDYFDLLKQLKEIVTARHVATAAVNAGGTGYVVGDVLTVVGGTSTHVATLEVTAVAAGVVTAVRITNAGAYSSDPTPTTANGVTGGTGTLCTIDITVANTGWTVVRESVRALSATVSAGGTGYAVNDEIDIDGGLGIGVSNLVGKATFVVASLSGSAVATVTVKSAAEGNYEETPANPAATTASVGTGTGCTLTVTYESRVPDDHSVIVLEGAAAGAPDPVQVGIKTYDDTDGIFASRNWALFGFAQDFSDVTLFHQQTGISPGITNADDGVFTTYGSQMPLKDNDGGGTYPLDFYMSVTDRRIMMAVRCNSATIDGWVTLHLGFTNQFGTTTELPYPVFIAGTCSNMSASILNVSISPVKSSIVHCLTDVIDYDAAGPAFMLNPAGVWRQVATGTLNSGNAFGRIDEWSVAPCGFVNIPNQTWEPGYDLIATGQLEWEDIIQLKEATAPVFPLWPMPDTVDTKLYMLVPVNVIVGTGAGNDPGTVWYPFGELDGLFWFSYADGGAGADALDYMDIGTDRYRIFRAAHRAELSNDFFVFKEA